MVDFHEEDASLAACLSDTRQIVYNTSSCRSNSNKKYTNRGMSLGRFPRRESSLREAVTGWLPGRVMSSAVSEAC